MITPEMVEAGMKELESWNQSWRPQHQSNTRLAVQGIIEVILREYRPASPVTGSADGCIEPRPANGLEERVRDLEKRIEKHEKWTQQWVAVVGAKADGAERTVLGFDGRLDRDEDKITDLQQQVAALNERVERQEARLALADTNPEADYIADTRDFDDADVPPQPVAEDEAKVMDPPPGDPRIHGPLGRIYAKYDSDPRVGGPNDFEAFADAVEGDNWEPDDRSDEPLFVLGDYLSTMAGGNLGASYRNDGRRVVRKAIELDLVSPRVSPDDSDQVRVVAETLRPYLVVASGPNVACNDIAKRILTALAAMGGGE